ncbi:MAG: alkyl hydroperoxide reductase [Alphaproteobacteria bacterium]|nr:MAG: alkyl hydroperoxide reductase [Alphaproteobacteria bacterium]TAF13457.1 MAG: alkyl hydroperoxide reductase [Alphaproteobacteria bacterium]TAF41280.1 MAG: alkyl hydroperoxide reductase [Alphaproteobacteria bacterium]TAF76285.1 MAG: alkyl hydroperoxide reductase [Alphaproteobacteria bacterium]
MTIETLRADFPDYARDTKINLSKILAEDSLSGLTLPQAHGIALAAAYATKQKAIIDAVVAETQSVLDEAMVVAAKAAATIMGMNNVYYRFVHLVNDKEYGTMPANLRMNIIGNPGIAKVDFELMSLAVSALNGCGMCMDAHVHEVIKAGVSKQAIQHTIRIAAVLSAAAQCVVIEGL